MPCEWVWDASPEDKQKKHGRISMLATMGYITPEMTGKFQIGAPTSDFDLPVVGAWTTTLGCTVSLTAF